MVMTWTVLRVAPAARSTGASSDARSQKRSYDLDTLLYGRTSFGIVGE